MSSVVALLLRDAARSRWRMFREDIGLVQE